MRTVFLLFGVLAVVCAHAADRTFDRRVAADPHGVVEISNVSGTIDISGWDNPEVEVHAALAAGVDRVDVTSEKNRTTIKVVVPSTTFHSISANLHVRVPRGSSLEVTGVSADVSALEVQGAERLKTVSGNIRADVSQQSAEMKTISGDITLRGSGQEGTARVSTVSGNVKVEHGAGDLEATTISGDLNVRLEPARTVRVRTTSGEFHFEGQLASSGNIDAESISGDLSVRAAPASGLNYELATFSGDISNCFGAEAERTSQFGPGHRLNGQRGTGGALAGVRLKTMSGDISLCDKQ